MVRNWKLCLPESRTYKGIVSSTAKLGYRSDLRAQVPKKDAPEKKLRGKKAKKAAAEADE
jgi:large subunit ribosomal protein L28e